jgi:hypothetical protein
VSHPENNDPRNTFQKPSRAPLTASTATQDSEKQRIRNALTASYSTSPEDSRGRGEPRPPPFSRILPGNCLDWLRLGGLVVFLKFEVRSVELGVSVPDY